MKSLAFGFAYGLLFLALFFVIGGSGHGLYFPLAFVAAPLSFFGIGFVLFVPFLTAVAFWSAAHRPRSIFLPLIAVHQLTAVVLGLSLFYKERDDGYASFLEKLNDLRWWIVALALSYLVGQALLWRVFVKSSRRQLS